MLCVVSSAVRRFETMADGAEGSLSPPNLGNLLIAVIANAQFAGCVFVARTIPGNAIGTSLS